MGLIRNFAMTPEEMASVRPLPAGAAWMSCHFAPEGLRDLPETLPEGSLLILDDSIPLTDQDPQKILDQLTTAIGRLRCQALLLDFQKPGNSRAPELIRLLQKALPCPVGISEPYSAAAEGPVFLPILPPHKSLEAYLKPWEGREIWLEVGPGAETARVTGKGTSFGPAFSPLPDCPHRHESLFCHYGIRLSDNEIFFTLFRSCEDLRQFTERAGELGVTRTIGLYQELF